MRRTVRWAGMCAIALFTAATQAEAGLIVVDGINAGATPAFSPFGGVTGFAWTAADVGWFYTPSASYDLYAIATKFGWADGRNVTVDIYNASSGLLPPASGDVPLRTASFTPLSNAFATGQFAPLSLTANQTYFVGFENVQGLGVNFTQDSGATALAGGLWYDNSNDGSFSSGPAGGWAAQPILEFMTDPVSAPEPSTLVLFGLGSVGAVVGVVHRRYRETRAPG